MSRRCPGDVQELNTGKALAGKPTRSPTGGRPDRKPSKHHTTRAPSEDLEGHVLGGVLHSGARMGVLASRAEQVETRTTVPARPFERLGGCLVVGNLAAIDRSDDVTHAHVRPGCPLALGHLDNNATGGIRAVCKNEATRRAHVHVLPTGWLAEARV
eukprot:CAMPEP_0115846396 /NCGR_PEP_ID=MMETSP0287-20121206/9840_1 /TAXON_ID=412157 /ORGANISM="Chrysochromulina rotalis, Strain UIO044" /LENGTH=156 /DNA_ID=CAMNT_0003300187 /DNA_START=398 /DNA_END=868 /DNA_ORIENTATION=+